MFWVSLALLEAPIPSGRGWAQPPRSSSRSRCAKDLESVNTHQKWLAYDPCRKGSRLLLCIIFLNIYIVEWYKPTKNDAKETAATGLYVDIWSLGSRQVLLPCRGQEAAKGRGAARGRDRREAGGVRQAGQRQDSRLEFDGFNLILREMYGLLIKWSVD